MGAVPVPPPVHCMQDTGKRRHFSWIKYQVYRYRYGLLFLILWPAPTWLLSPQLRRICPAAPLLRRTSRRPSYHSDSVARTTWPRWTFALDPGPPPGPPSLFSVHPPHHSDRLLLLLQLLSSGISCTGTTAGVAVSPGPNGSALSAMRLQRKLSHRPATPT